MPALVLLLNLAVALAGPTRIVWLGDTEPPDDLSEHVEGSAVVVPLFDLDQCARNDAMFVDADADRAALFTHLAKTGHAAEEQEVPRNIAYGELGGELVNLAWARAGLLAREDEALLDTVSNPVIADSIRYYRDHLDVDTVIDLDGLKATRLIVDGHDVAVPEDGQVPWSGPWRDLVVVREDGFGPSQRHRPTDPETATVAGRAEFRVATWNLSEALHRRQPVVLDGEAATCLRIYDALYPGAEVVLGLPKGRRHARTWTWDSDTATATPRR